MAGPARRGHHALVLIGLVVGIAGSAWVGLAAHDQRLEPALPGPWLTASLALAVLVMGWVLAAVSPRFAAALAAGLLPGAAYAAMALAGDGSQQLAYAWCAIAVALGWVAVVAGCKGQRRRSRPWSVRRRTAPRVPRVRTH